MILYIRKITYTRNYTNDIVHGWGLFEDRRSLSQGDFLEWFCPTYQEIKRVFFEYLSRGHCYLNWPINGPTWEARNIKFGWE